jgi:hypothetical protein
MGIQSYKNPNFENFGAPNLGILGKNDIWVQALWPSNNKGEGGGFPKSNNVYGFYLIGDAFAYILFFKFIC